MLSIPEFADPFSSVTHLVAAFASGFGGILLIKKARGSALRIASLVIYVFGMMFLFSMSGVYHWLDRDGLARVVLQRLDHAAIWIMIAGSFTPIHVILFRGVWRWGALAAIWGLAITGLVLKTIFFKEIPMWASLSFYLLLGWLGTLTAWKAYQLHGSRPVKLLLAGGLAYSVGAIIEGVGNIAIIPNVIGSHEIFHIFVILGALIHWLFIYEFANEPVFDHITFTVIEYPDNTLLAKARGERLSITAQSKNELIVSIRKSLDNRYQGYTCPSHIHLNFVQVHPTNNLRSRA